MATEPVTCSRPPALTEDELEAALEGAVDATIEEHLVQCSYCAARLEAMQRFERTLQVRLARRNCPNVSSLGDYALGIQDAQTKRRVEAHLTTCIRCADELRIIQAALSGRRAEGPRQRDRLDNLSKGIGRWVIHLQEQVARLLPPAPGPALRGAHPVKRLVAATERERIIIEAASQGNRQRLMGQVLSDDFAAWEGALVEVYHGDALAATAFLDDTSEFACEGLTASVMRVMITAPNGQRIVIHEIRFDA